MPGQASVEAPGLWLSFRLPTLVEAGQRAAGSLAGRMPAPPVALDQDGALVPAPPPVTEDSPPYLRIAADLRAAIQCGALQPGDPLPTQKELQQRYGAQPAPPTAP